MKKLAMGIIIGLLIGFAGSAYAEVGRKVEAVFAKYVIKVDGVEQNLDADPMVYQGTIYVPLRVFATMLGKDVTYLASERTVELNDPEPMEQRPDSTQQMRGGDEMEPMTLEDIETKITDTKALIFAHERWIERGDTVSLPRVEEYRNELARLNQILADLEAQKAALEAQLAQ